jgi:integrase
MPSGACVIAYDGKRGVVWFVKYRDADGRQVKERVGRESDGWTRQKAERELGKRLDAVDKGMRKTTRRTFNDLADEFERITLEAKPRKRSTLIDYRATLNNHLRVWFGHEDLGALSRAPEEFERYIARKLAKGLSPKTVRNHLALLSLMFKQARKWRWVSDNPLELVDAPPLDEVEAETLTAEEISRLVVAYRQLAADVPENAYWYDAARRMTVVALSTGLRRGELLGLRWQDVELLDKRVRVRQAFVRGEMTTPKSRAGRRTVQIGSHAIGALEEQFKTTRYQDADSVVFCHEALGTPLDPSKLTGFARKAFKAAAIDKPFRPWHGLRHTALTETAAANLPAMFVQAKAGHAQGSTTERYLHASKSSFPDAAELAEARLFTDGGTKTGTK